MAVGVSIGSIGVDAARETAITTERDDYRTHRPYNTGSRQSMSNGVDGVNEAVILSGYRTPIGKFLGGLSSLSATELGGRVVAEAVKRAGVGVETVEEVIMGCVLPAGLGQAPARQAALKGGLPPTVAALTVNKVCGSGLKAVMLAAQAIRAGDIECAVAGGMESMSRAPFLLEGARSGLKFGEQKLLDHMQFDGLTCAFEHCSMGFHAEHIAKVKSVSREDQDRFSVESQRRAAAAIASGAFRQEILPIQIPSKKETIAFATDESPRADTTFEGLSKLKPSFDPAGTVTAGNASGLSDGAAALAVASDAFAKKHGLKPLARIVAYATSGTEPKDLFIAPVFAIRKALEKAKLALADIDLFEINEAFAAQMVACARGLEIPPDRLNVNGGAIALGHPIGASGARVLVTLLHALQQRGKKTGVASLCLGGGNAVAMVIELAKS